jgi:hypothetical protein
MMKFQTVPKMGNKEQENSFVKQLEMKIDGKFAEWKVDVMRNFESFKTEQVNEKNKLIAKEEAFIKEIKENEEAHKKTTEEKEKLLRETNTMLTNVKTEKITLEAEKKSLTEENKNQKLSLDKKTKEFTTCDKENLRLELLIKANDLKCSVAKDKSDDTQKQTDDTRILQQNHKDETETAEKKRNDDAKKADDKKKNILSEIFRLVLVSGKCE